MAGAVHREASAAPDAAAVPRGEAYQRARSAFDYFDHESMAFMENAGGSQVPRCVAAAVSDYTRFHNANLGAGYARSNRASGVVRQAHEWVEVLMNTRGQGEVVIGASTSQLMFNLAAAYAEALGPGDEVVLQEASHEAAVGPWVRQSRLRGFSVRWWRADRASGASDPAQLEALLGPATRVVVVTHVSNLLGEILDLGGLVQRVRRLAPRAHVVADGVAYAPHRAMDVSAWGVDWYVWSVYKVFGPRVAALYGRADAYAALLASGGQGPNHSFVDPADMTYKFELGRVCQEACAGVLALQDYFLYLLGRDGQAQATAEAETGQSSAASPQTIRPTLSPAPPPPRNGLLDRAGVEAAFALMTEMEQPLQERLVPFLCAHPALRLVGPAAVSDPRVRVPTISFVHRSKSSKQVAAELQASGFAVRSGFVYSRRLVEALLEPGGLLAVEAAARQQRQQQPQQLGTTSGSAPASPEASSAPFDMQVAIDDGVVRVSLVHYNTLEEVEALMGALERVM